MLRDVASLIRILRSRIPASLRNLKGIIPTPPSVALQPGTRLGAYDVLALIGAGGMGEVYKARDTRLDRVVALKVLPAHVASDPDLRQRFDREARAVAALNHPHICTLHDIGSQDGIAFLVMEYLEGETLADKLAKGPLPIDQALRYAIEIADALDKAHRQGITHRDLKPGNIMLTKGCAKLLDFGLAKAGAPIIAATGLSMLPTTPPGLTAQGTILGTFQYMAPEQLEGQEADARTDMFAFGAVLYEMLTGKKAFEGKSQASLIAAILDREPPPISTLKPLMPPALDRVVHKCLAKDADARWQSARDLHDELQWIQQNASEGAPTASDAARVKSGERRLWMAATVTVVAASALAAVAFVLFRETPRVEPPLHLSIALPENTSVRSLALSPDGRSLVIAATIGSQYHLWLRTLGASDLRPLAGTDNARVPFWSPDSRFIGFFAEGKLKTMPATGGPAQVLCDAALGKGGSWNRDGVILFAASPADPIYRVAAAGGPCTPITKPTSGTFHNFPEFLPDGQHFFYVVGGDEDSQRGVYLASLADSVGRRVLADVSSVAYVLPSAGNPSSSVLFLRENTLMALPFNPTTLQPAGDVFPIATQASRSNSPPQMAASAATNGALAYLVNGESVSGNLQLSWRDRLGKELTKETESSSINSVGLSPDAKTIATARGPQYGLVIWLRELGRESESRFSGSSSAPVWSPDSSHVVFSASRGRSVSDLYSKDPGGSQEELVLQTGNSKSPSDWSPDGHYLVYTEVDPKTLGDIWLLPDPLSKTAERKPVPFLRTPFDESHGQVSPDGRWIAYASNESGQYEIYVRPFPSGEGRWQVSTRGGVQPRWRHDGQELFYLEGLVPRFRLMAAPITAWPRPPVGSPKLLFDIHVGTQVPTSNTFSYSPSADGQRFLVSEIPADVQTTLDVLVNWQKMLPASK
jgi:eukaryotic-like serine/threonine-protein kinase